MAINGQRVVPVGSCLLDRAFEIIGRQSLQNMRNAPPERNTRVVCASVSDTVYMLSECLFGQRLIPKCLNIGFKAAPNHTHLENGFSKCTHNQDLKQHPSGRSQTLRIDDGRTRPAAFVQGARSPSMQHVSRMEPEHPKAQQIWKTIIKTNKKTRLRRVSC